MFRPLLHLKAESVLIQCRKNGCFNVNILSGIVDFSN